MNPRKTFLIAFSLPLGYPFNKKWEIEIRAENFAQALTQAESSFINIFGINPVGVTMKVL